MKNERFCPECGAKMVRDGDFVVCGRTIGSDREHYAEPLDLREVV